LAQALCSGQTLPHAPQLRLSQLVSMHAPPQFVKPGPHSVPPPPSASWQTPPTQFWPGLQTTPHAPQFEGSSETSRQIPSQRTCPPKQPSLPVQVPLTHVVPELQTFPQAPQLLLSVEVLTHVVPQRDWPDGHSLPPPCWQLPFTQRFPLRQRRPQPPQWLSLLRVSMQLPLQ
jgi:hypothetical protein